MPEQPVDTRCPACETPVFDGHNVVRCNRCEALHHEPCWERRSGCSARTRCRGKPENVLVVRLPATVDAAELSAVAGQAAAAHVAEVALPRVEAKVESRAASDDLAAARSDVLARLDALEEAVSGLVRADGDDTRNALERLRTQVDAAAATVRALAAPGASLASTMIDGVSEALNPGLDARFAALEERLDAVAEETRTMLRVTEQQLREKLSETHFAVDSARRPFPWDDMNVADVRGDEG